MSGIKIGIIIVSIISLIGFTVFAVENTAAAVLLGFTFLAGCLYGYIVHKNFGKEKVVYIPYTVTASQPTPAAAAVNP